ncbi:CAP domain-containing protein [Haloplanus halophilus]|uniref:CAP domain-containing protein n=1 Tax=Haloplanus halophilus TaxID=2949993 RepID=UPI00203FFA1E|nr:CAP domain-containing protein [Haloplanus sp. GDY1]
MRWRQVVLAAALAVGAASAAARFEGATPTESLAVALLVYVGVRVLIGTYYRTRYWYGRSGRNTRKCPQCGRRISRRAGDLVTKCYHTTQQHHHKPPDECGYIAGFPVTRLFTQSVVTRQVVRSVTWERLGVIALAGVLLFAPVSISAGGTLAGGAGGAAAATGGTATATPAATASARPTATATSTATATPNPPPPRQKYDLSEVETVFIEMLNTERESRGLQPVTQRDVLTEMGRSHSADMAEHDYIGHEEPDGSTIKDRYRERGLLPECRLPISGSGRYYAGTENAAHFWVNKDVRTANGTIHVDSERDIAQGLFVMWMNSRDHREAMLVSSADEAGLGIYIDGRGKVYASLELC